MRLCRGIWGGLILAGLTWAQEKEPPDTALGRRLYESQCALCHGQNGEGGRGPNLRRPRLKHAADQDALVAVIRNGLPGTEMPGAWQMSAREQESVAAYVRSLGTIPVEALPGKPGRGAEVYRKAGCASCHIVEGQGTGYGPELTDIGARRSAAYLKDALVRPAAAFPQDFLLVEAVTAEGRVILGLRLNEDSFFIQLRDAATAFHSFRKSELKELRKLFDVSPMPSYEKTLPPGDIEDLVAYLAGLRGKS